MKFFKKIFKYVLPSFVLEFYQSKSKERSRKNLQKQKLNGNIIGKKEIEKFLKNAGIQSGDTILVHSSLSKIGYVDGGANTIVQVLMDYIGENGNILMPSSPNPKLQLHFLRENSIIDLDTIPSAMGTITEIFRNTPNVKRSIHPTEPVCAWGKDASYFTQGHLNELTPYTQNSPFFRITEKKGKILYIGVSLDNAGTSLHLLEDALEFKFPIYHSEIFKVSLLSEGNQYHVETKVHNPEYSKKRKCDELIPFFKENKVCEEFSLGKARCFVFDAKKMFDTMIAGYQNKGITMYTPKGSS